MIEKCLIGCVEICDFCIDCIHDDELNAPIGCVTHPEKFSETGYCDNFRCFTLGNRPEYSTDEKY